MESTYRETIVLDGRDETGRAVQSATRNLGTFERMARGMARMPISIVDRASAPLRAIGRSLAGVAQMAAGFIVAQGLYELPGFLMDAAKAAATDQASVMALQRAVENSGGSWAKYGDQLNATVDAGIKKGFADDQSRDALTLLIAQTGSATEAQKRYAIAQDLARGANIDVVTASKLLGKVTEDNVNVLARYGLKVKKGTTETQLFAEIQKKFGGQAQTYADSAAGMLDAFNLQIGELKEQLGYILLPLLGKLAGFLNQVVVPLFSDVLIPALADLGNVAAAAIEPFLPLLGKVRDLGLAVWGSLGGVLDTLKPLLAGPIAQAKDIVYGLADAASALFQAVTSDPGALGVLGDLIQSAFGPTVAGFARTFLSVGMKLIPTIGKIADAFGLLVSGKIDFDVLLQAVGKLLRGLGGTIQHEATVLGGRLWTWFTTAAIPKAREQLNRLVDGVKRWVTGGGLERLKRNVLGLAAGAWSWLETAAGKAGTFLQDNIIAPVKGWVDAGGPGKIADALVTMGDKAWDWVTTAAGKAGDFLGGLVDGVKKWVDAGGPGQVSDALLKLADSAWTWVQNAASWAGIYLGQIIDSVKNWVAQGGPQQVADALSSLALQAWDWVQNAASWASMNLMPIVTAIGDWASKTAAPALVTAGSTLGQKLYDGVDTGFNAAVTAGGLQPGMDKLSQGLDRMKVSENLNQSWINWGASLYVVNGLLTDINNTMGGTGTNFLMKAADTVMTGLVITVGLITKGLQEASASVLAWLLGLKQTLEWFRNNPAFFEYLQKASDLITAVNNPSVANVATVVKDATGGSQTTPATSTTDPGGGGGAGGFPEHAAGGIAVRPQLGIVGEAGPEAIVPLDQAGRFGFGGGTSFGDVNVSVSVAISANDMAGLDPDKLAKRLGPAMAREFAKQMTRMAPGVVGGVA